MVYKMNMIFLISVYIITEKSENVKIQLLFIIEFNLDTLHYVGPLNF